MGNFPYATEKIDDDKLFFEKEEPMLEKEESMFEKEGPMSIYLINNPVESYSKYVFKQNFDIKTIRKEYNFENNQIKINCNVNDENIKIMKDMWITNVDKIKQFELCIKYNVYEKNICKLSITALNNLNKMMYEKNYDNYLKLNMLRIPIDEYSMVVGGLANFDVIIKIVTTEPINNLLIVNYKLVTDPKEISLYKKRAHEYLTRQYITVKQYVHKGENILNISPHVFSISHFFINSNKTTVLNVKSNIYNAYGFEDVKLCIASKDPEYKNYEIDDHETYIYDVYKNINNATVQPYGMVTINDNTKLYISSSEDTYIEVTYVIYNILRYNIEMCGFAYDDVFLTKYDKPSGAFMTKLQQFGANDVYLSANPTMIFYRR